MTTLFKFTDVDGDRMSIFDADIPGTGPGVNIKTDRNGCSVPDYEIPELAASLQNYMSRRAKAITAAAKGGK